MHHYILLLYVLLSCIYISTAKECSSLKSESLDFNITSRRNLTGHWIGEVTLEHGANEENKVFEVDVHHTTTECDGDKSVIVVATVRVPPQTTKELDSSYNLVLGLGYYKMHNRQLKWNAAREVCATEGAHLLILNSDAEWEVVKQMWDNSTFASNPYMLTGMSDFAQEGIFVTLFGNPISMIGYNKWDSGEPGEGISASCGYINKKGLLHDGVCEADYNIRPFICEVPLP